MSQDTSWTSADLELLPDDGKRHEIIDGELHVSKQPGWHHQFVCGQAFALLQRWSDETQLGQANIAPGVIFADDGDVAPDVVWVSKTRLTAVLEADGHLHGAPDLVAEVLAPGSRNEQRDREAKLKLYSSRGVSEYWIISWQRRLVEVYRRQHAALRLIGTLYEGDALESPLLPGLSYLLEKLFARVK